MFFNTYFNEIYTKISDIDYSNLIKVSDLILDTSQKGKKVIVVGNGGSAAMASHISIDLTKAANIRSINFNEADLLTCFANDFGYEYWVSKALEFYADKYDTIILFSSSGSSKNILNGAKTARSMGLNIVTFSGFKSNNLLKELGDINFWVDSNSYNIVEMAHHIWTVAIVDYIIETKKKK